MRLRGSATTAVLALEGSGDFRAGSQRRDGRHRPGGSGSWRPP